jgi:hypothetical protein
VSNCIIPSTHAERKITVCSHKHSLTPYPSLSPYRQTDRITDRGTNTLAARGLEEIFFQLCRVSVFFLLRKIVLLLTYHSSCAIVFGFTGQFFGSGGKRFSVLLTYQPYQLCRCVSFLVVAGNSFWLHSF